MISMFFFLLLLLFRGNYAFKTWMKFYKCNSDSDVDKNEEFEESNIFPKQWGINCMSWVNMLSKHKKTSIKTPFSLRHLRFD